MDSLDGRLRHFWAVGPRRSATCVNCTLETHLHVRIYIHMFRRDQTLVIVGSGTVTPCWYRGWSPRLAKV